MNSTVMAAPELHRADLPFGAGCWGVRVRAAGRLSFTLIDLNGNGGRRNGMASMSLRDPSFQAVVRPADRVAVVDDDGRARHVAEIVEFLRALRKRWQTPPAEVVVEQPLPAHTGFGSKTTTLLAIGKAYMQLCGRVSSTEELAQTAGRAGTSGASVNLIDAGGFLIDGGHANPPDFGEDPQRYLVPSRFAGAARKPPPLVSMPFPPWPILIFLGVGTELSGAPELDWFRETLPIPVEEARRTAHHMLMHMAPAVAESDYGAFCDALNVLTYEHHYKQEQIAVQSEEIKTVFREARDAAEIDAIGLSVTGPMCFAFSRRPADAVAWVESLRSRGLVREHWWSCAQNHPVVLEGVPA
ncbi:MAG: beta-ribofuranosylaminobenzene 5'-phosphate synthase family protein [Solirubrobacterales bacterium]